MLNREYSIRKRGDEAKELGKGQTMLCIILYTAVRTLEFILNVVDVIGGFKQRSNKIASNFEKDHPGY